MSAPTDKSPLPDYANPPVVETILGVQFERLPGFKNAHLGAFWKTLDPLEWPTVSDAPPLPPVFERFTEPARWVKALQIQLSQIPASRLQIKNRPGDRMIQVQNERLHFNWLGDSGGNYPHYEAVREGFVEALARFTDFIAQANVGGFQPHQWEVTYLNHIPKGTVWNTPDDLSFFLPLAKVPTLPGLVQGESFGGEWHFVIAPKRGRLHVECRHGLKTDADEQEMIVLTLTARGPIAESGDPAAILDGLDLGHDVIVRSFASLMSKPANDNWGLRNADS